MSERQKRHKKGEKQRYKARKRQAKTEAERANVESKSKAVSNPLPTAQTDSPQKKNAHEPTAERKANDKPIGDKNDQLVRTQDKRRILMSDAVYLFATFGAILGLTSGILIGVIHFCDLGVWFGCTAVVAFVISSFGW